MLRYIGMVMLLNAVFLLISALISYFNARDTALYPLLLSAVLTGALGGFPLLFVDKIDHINMKEGYAIVVGAWIIACLIGTFPYLLWGGEFTLASAWFESVSGFTTTGATTLTNIERLPRGLLFWRSCTHWLGGVGVVMFTLLILPALGRMKMTLSQAELSPLARDNYKYKAAKIVQILLILYVGLTLVETILLRIAGMDWFDAVNHSFSTIATGGFSTKNASIAFYDSPWIEAILGFFMMICGIHFGLLFATITGKRNNLLRSEVTRFYLATIFVSGLFISLNLWGTGVYSSLPEALRHGYFQTVSVITTTGFATADTTLWTPLAIVILIWLTLQCGCAGSTSGGLKSDRIWLTLKVLRARVLQLQHPNAVIRVKLNSKTQEESVISFAILFIVIYLLTIVAGTIIVAATGLDLETSFTMVTSCMGNIGPGFGEVGSMSNYAEISPMIQFFCTVFMLLGRLEIFGFIQLFLFRAWK